LGSADGAGWGGWSAIRKKIQREKIDAEIAGRSMTTSWTAGLMIESVEMNVRFARMHQDGAYPAR
jgi:hypothetical protein